MPGVCYSSFTLQVMQDTSEFDIRLVPSHIAIIMDGNGRWAEERHKPRLAGHKAGVASVRSIVETAREIGVRYLTLYAFSTENWKRPRSEVKGLMALLRTYLESELRTMLKTTFACSALVNVKGCPGMYLLFLIGLWGRRRIAQE